MIGNKKLLIFVMVISVLSLGYVINSYKTNNEVKKNSIVINNQNNYLFDVKSIRNDRGYIVINGQYYKFSKGLFDTIYSQECLITGVRWKEVLPPYQLVKKKYNDTVFVKKMNCLYYFIN